MKKIITILLATVLSASLFGFVGCDKKEAGTLVSGFETYDELVNMRWLNDFGSAKLTTDKKYVTEGEHAVHLQINGDYRTNRNPAMGLVLGTRYEKTDYSDVEKITVDVYNDNDFTANVYFQYLTKSKDTPLLSSENKVELPANTMTKAEFIVDRDFLSKLLRLDQVLQLRLVFDRATSYMQPYRSFYVDNLRYHVTDKPIDENYEIRKADEIESADKPEYLSAWQNINQYQYTPSNLEFNTDPAFIKGGTGSFKMTNITGYFTTPTYGAGWKTTPYITDISDYSSLSYWIYNQGETDISVFMANGDLTAQVYVGIAKANQWSQIVIPVKTFEDNKFDLENFDSFRIVVGFPSDTPCAVYFDEIMMNK
ncbi:MAG: hypothetical protein ACI4ST_08100 [Candidatus Gallimonas sp.]